MRFLRHNLSKSHLRIYVFSANLHLGEPTDYHETCCHFWKKNSAVPIFCSTCLGFWSGSIKIGDWCFMFHQPLRLSPKPGSKTFSGRIPFLNPPVCMKMAQISAGAPNATLVECLSAHPVWPPSPGALCRWRKNEPSTW